MYFGIYVHRLLVIFIKRTIAQKRFTEKLQQLQDTFAKGSEADTDL